MIYSICLGLSVMLGILWMLRSMGELLIWRLLWCSERRCTCYARFRVRFPMFKSSVQTRKTIWGLKEYENKQICKIIDSIISTLIFVRLYCKYISYLLSVTQALLSLKLDEAVWVVQHYLFIYIHKKSQDVSLSQCINPNHNPFTSDSFDTRS